MKGPRISLDPVPGRTPKPSLPGLPRPLVPLRSRRPPPQAAKKKTPAPNPYQPVRDGLTLLGWCAMFLTFGFVAAAQPPSTYNFFARMGYTRTLWDRNALMAALIVSVVAALVAAGAIALPRRPGEVRPRLWLLLAASGLASAVLGWA